MKTMRLLILSTLLSLGASAYPLVAEEAAPAADMPAAAPAGEGDAERPLPPGPAAEAGDEERPEDEPGRVERVGDEITVDMSFEKADIVTVLRMLGRLAKATLAIDADLEGQVTIAATGRIPLTEAFEIMNSVLQVKGYTLVGRLGDGVLKVLPEKEAVTSPHAVGIGKQPEDIPEHDTYLTQVIPVEFIDAQRLARELKPMVSSDKGALVASSLTNHLIITDTASNVKRLVSVISELDKDLTSVMDVEVFPLQYANAETTARMLTQMFEQPRTGPGFRLDPRTGRPSPGGSSGRPPGGGARPTPMLPGLMQAKEQIKIQSDERTNSLIVSASKERIDLIKQIVEKIDINLEPDIKVEVFKLENAEASTVAEELNQILEQPQGGASSRRFSFPWSRSSYYSSYARRQTRLQGMTGLRENIIVPDVRNNSLIVTGTTENVQQIGELIKQLDVVAPLTDIIRIYPLENANAEDVENTLERVFFGQSRFRGFFSFLFGGRGGQQGAMLDILQNISVEGDETTNSLVVTAPPQAHEIVEAMIGELDQAQRQVFIEVAIVDVTLDDTNRLGIEWQWATEGQPQDTVGTNFNVAQAPEFAEGLRYTVVGRELNAVLAALIQKNDVRVLSHPSITTTNNVRAEVSVGTQFPYVREIATTAAGQVIPRFDFYDISVDLQVTPRIKTRSGVAELLQDKLEPGEAASPAEETPRTEQHHIQLEIVQSINELQGTVNQLNFTQPIIGSREARTTVSVADGETIVLGGMIRESTQRLDKKVPLLGDLPLIGNLFRSKDERKINNELLVFLTPYVLSGDDDILTLKRRVERRTDALKQRGLLGSAKTKVWVGEEGLEGPEDAGAPTGDATAAGDAAAPATPAVAPADADAA